MSNIFSDQFSVYNEAVISTKINQALEALLDGRISQEEKEQPAKLWRDADYESRQAFQRILFPQWLTL